MFGDLWQNSEYIYWSDPKLRILICNEFIVYFQNIRNLARIIQIVLFLRLSIYIKFKYNSLISLKILCKIIIWWGSNINGIKLNFIYLLIFKPYTSFEMFLLMVHMVLMVWIGDLTFLIASLSWELKQKFF